MLFTRYPESGKVKTRLIPALGPDGAASLQRRLTVHCVQTAKIFTTCNTMDFIIYFDGSTIPEMQKLFGEEFCYQRQSHGNLGQRMCTALSHSLGQGRRRVVLIGSDCPGITGQVLNSAFSRLTDHDLVLGPACDGGYYLIGLTALYPALFDDIPWGTERVLALTQARAARLGLKTALLEPLMDIDRPEDLPVWEEILRSVGHD